MQTFNGGILAAVILRWWHKSMESCSLVQLTNAEEVREVLSELFSVGQGAVGLNQHQALFVKIKNLVRKHMTMVGLSNNVS